MKKYIECNYIKKKKKKKKKQKKKKNSQLFFKVRFKTL